MALAAFTKTCGAHVPGIQELWLWERSNFTSAAMTSNELTGTALAATGGVQIIPDIDGIEVNQTLTSDKNGKSFWEKNIIINTSNIYSEAVKLIRDILSVSPCGLIAAYKTNNGTWWVSGLEYESATTLSCDRGLYLGSSEIKTGKAPEDDDADMILLTLQGNFPQADYIVIPDGGAITVSATGIAVAA